MRKNERVVMQMIERLGLEVVETYRTRHLTFVVRTPGGNVFNVQSPTCLGNSCTIHNMKSQIRRRVAELDAR